VDTQTQDLVSEIDLVDHFSAEFDTETPVQVEAEPEDSITCNSELVTLAAQQYGSLLRTYFYNRLRSYNDVEDLLQELYCRLLTYRHPLHVKSIKSFVFTIALNLLRDRSRRTVTRMATKMTPLEEAEELPSPTTDPLRIVEGVEALLQVGQTIDELQPACKKAFYLHRVYGKSHKEISVSMGVTVSMVEKYIMAAIRYLRKVKAGQV
jgi:RNA polymerase sigma factor (sigma-70 family)